MLDAGESGDGFAAELPLQEGAKYHKHRRTDCSPLDADWQQGVDAGVPRMVTGLPPGRFEPAYSLSETVSCPATRLACATHYTTSFRPRQCVAKLGPQHNLVQAAFEPSNGLLRAALSQTVPSPARVRFLSSSTVTSTVWYTLCSSASGTVATAKLRAAWRRKVPSACRFLRAGAVKINSITLVRQRG